MDTLQPGRANGWANAVQRIEVPSLDVEAYIRPISAKTLLGWANADDASASAELVAASLCDQFGESLGFTPEECLEWPAALFQTICTAALKLNGLDTTAEARVGN